MQEKYNAVSFKTARALKNKLVKFDVMSQWADLLGTETDFLNADLKTENALANINGFATVLESFMGQRNDLLGYVLVELSRFCVPGHNSGRNILVDM